MKSAATIPEPPKILPIEVSVQRPFWSVMIPVYNPPANYLEQTLRSVLQQAPEASQMQIEVVDDCSSSVDVKKMVESIAGPRVAVSKTPKNLGLAGCWNACVERSRGEWVHILHQDDIVQPGFYAALRKAADDPKTGAAFCRHATINSNGNWLSISALHRETPGILENWSEEISMRQQIQCPAIVVRRAAFERLGSFRPQFRYVLDWEMWQRIAAKYAFWFEPTILAGYRVHSGSETSKLQLEGADIQEVEDMINLTMTYHPASRAPILAKQARTFWAEVAVKNSRRLLVAGQSSAAWKQIGGAVSMARNWPVVCEFFSFLVLRARLAGARLKQSFR